MTALPPHVLAVHDRQTNTTRIRGDVDQKYRRALLEAARQRGGKTALWHIRNSLDNGPSRGGLAEAMKYFGWADLQHPDLVLTARIVDGIEIAVPGFKKWLELTGFGNDKTMIKGFIAWSEFTLGKGHVIGEAKREFER